MTAEQRLNQPDAERLTAHFRMMSRIRAFELAAGAAQKDGHVTGAIHQTIGQEAIATGICANLRTDDLLVSNHRGHGHTLAKGADPTAMMCELFGKAGGTSGGKGGSMHIADFSIGMLGANGVVAAGIPIAVGAAQAIKVRGEDKVVTCFFGDGALNRGPFLEGLNWAAIYDLPVIFVCEDNGFAAMTRTRDLTAGPGPVARAQSLGVESHAVDGNDVLAVDALAARLTAAVRQNAKPVFICASTYRLAGHTTADRGGYRPDGEVEDHRAREPIGRARVTLTELGIAEAELDRIVADAKAEMQAVVEAGVAAPWPDTPTTFTDVQDMGAPHA